MCLPSLNHCFHRFNLSLFEFPFLRSYVYFIPSLCSTYSCSSYQTPVVYSWHPCPCISSVDTSVLCEDLSFSEMYYVIFQFILLLVSLLLTQPLLNLYSYSCLLYTSVNRISSDVIRYTFLLSLGCPFTYSFWPPFFTHSMQVAYQTNVVYNTSI